MSADPGLHGRAARSLFRYTDQVGVWCGDAHRFPQRDFRGRPRASNFSEKKNQHLRPPRGRKKRCPNRYFGLHKTEEGQTALLAATYDPEGADSGRKRDVTGIIGI